MDEIGRQRDEGERLDGGKDVRPPIDRIELNVRAHARLLEQRRRHQRPADQILGDHPAGVVGLGDRNRRGRLKFHFLAHEPLVAGTPS